MARNAYLKAIEDNLLDVEKMREHKINTYEVVLLCLLLEKHPSISGLIRNELIDKSFVDVETGEISNDITPGTMYPKTMFGLVPINENQIKDILLDVFQKGGVTEKEEKEGKGKKVNSRSRKELLELSKNFIAIFPKGKKEGTNYSFRTSPVQISGRFTKFFINFGNYSDEDILKAATRYVKYFEDLGDRTHMRLAKYFIFKNDKDKGLESQLYEEIINLDEEMENASVDSFTDMAYNIK